MRSIRLFYLIAFLLGTIVFSQEKSEEFPALKGPYLGQKPPSMMPEIFAPGIISTHYSQSYIAFLNGARVCVFSTSAEKGHETYFTFEKNGRWTTPQKAPFEELQGHPNYTTGPLGRKVYYHSGNPTHPDDDRPDDNIWTIEWNGSNWEEPVALPEPANSEYGEAYPSATADGTVYFFTWRREGTRGYDIWFSRCNEGGYQEAERLPWPINTDFIEYDPYVAPDESFLIFGSDRPGGFGKSDNYICFRKEDGSWTPPINLGRPYNSSSFDLCANGTPDGKYFFFLSGRKTDVEKGEIGLSSGKKPEEDADLYWADFSFICGLKNALFTKQSAAKISKEDYRENGIHSAVNTLNRLYYDQKDSVYFLPFELLSLAKDMITEDKIKDADLFYSALDKLLPKDLSIKEGYARICAMNGRVSKGLKTLEELESEDPNFDLSDSLSGLGYLFTLYPDKIDDALSVLRFTVEKFPDDPWAYYSLARVYRQLGDLDKAIVSCQKSLELRPDVGDISQLLERLLEERKRKKESEESFPVLKSPYFGQKPPGITPEIFAPGIVTTELSEFGITVSPDGKDILFTRTFVNPRKHVILHCSYENNQWTIPQKAAFSGEYSQAEPNFSPDGNKLYFSEIQKNSEGRPISMIVVVEKISSVWGKPVILFPGMFATVTSTGDIYFTDVSAGEKRANIARALSNSFDYSETELLNDKQNGIYQDAHPFVSPEEEFILFDSNRPGGFGDSDLYICYRNKNASWGVAINLGEDINSEGYDAIPSISPDGKYLFFCKDGDIYWVDAKVIEDLKPIELK